MDDDEAAAAPAAVRPTKRFQASEIDLGARVRALRIDAGMSRSALGAAAGVSLQQMQRYETGKDRVSASTLFSFAVALNVPVGSFYEGPSQDTPAETDEPFKPARSAPSHGLSRRIIFLSQQITDPGIRKQLVALATTLAEGQAHGTPEITDEDDM